MHHPLLPLAVALCILSACSHAHEGEDEHAHDADGNHVTAEVSELEPLVYTLYTAKTEFFVEFKPLVVGEESRFAAHFTALGERFTAVDAGAVTLSLKQADHAQSVTATEPEVPGIFRLRLTPDRVGTYELSFLITTPEYRDTVTVAGVVVYADRQAAGAAAGGDEIAESDITYLKEQAWKVDFATTPARVQDFSEVVNTSGELLSTPGDERVLAAQISGTVTFAEATVVGSEVAAGRPLFTIRSSEVVRSDLSSAITEGETELSTARLNFERAAELVKDQIISQREYLAAERNLKNAETRLANVSVSRGFNQRNQRVQAPMAGYLREIAVENGGYVNVGQPLATVGRNNRLLLRVDLAQRYFPQLASFTEANFKLPGREQVYQTEQLGGRRVSVGRSAEAGSPFVPLHFEIDYREGLLPGAMVEVFLLSAPRPRLVIPVSALLEEMGVFYAYVQMSGESFQKRELQLGASDGVDVAVFSGVEAGERVVTTGGYQIKLSTASGTLPAHGHEH